MTKIVDREVPNRGNYKIYDDYAVLLNQTDIGNNNNKFYIIQLLIDKDNEYYLWTRWGRVGESGKNDLDRCGTNEEDGISAFKKKFKDKTSNHWDKRDSFVTKSGKYTIVETNEKEGEDATGKLSQGQIEKGQIVLKEIEKYLEKDDCDNTQLISLSSQFFTLIPTVSGRKRPDPITTIDMLHEKEELLKFYLRMGFDVATEEDTSGLTPISGIMDLPLPSTLLEAISKCCDKGSITSSVTRGAKLANDKVGNPTKPMSKELYGSILLYTSNAIYKDLNKALREENRAGIKKYFMYLRMLFEAMNILPKNKVTLWRGLSVDLSKQYKKDDIITWWGVSSCTSDKNVAINFMNGCGGEKTLLTIDTISATDISEITFYSNEKESLLAPGTQLKVISIEKKDKTAYIHLQEVGRVIT
jgi:predicted DNA-binding WGR domain protein